MKIRVFESLIVLGILLCVLPVFSQSLEEIEKLVNQGNYDEASVKIESVLKRQPNNEAVLSQKIRILVIKQQFTETEALANKILTRNPQNKIALNARGLVKRESKKDYVAALADFDKALAIDAEYPQAAANRAITLYSGKIGKKSDALDATSFAIELNSDNAILRSIRGNLLNNFGNYMLALADFNKALSVNKNMPVYAEKAYAELQIGSTNDALANAETVLRMSPNNSLALAIRAFCKYTTDKAKEKERIELIADAEKALQLDPQNYLARMVLAFDKENMKKDKAGTFAELQAAYKLQPNKPWVIERVYDFLRLSPELRKDNPTAENMFKETSTKVEALWRKQLELKKLAVSSEPWDFQLYNDLENVWSKLISFLDKDYFAQKRVPSAWKAEKKVEYDYWQSLSAQNPKNLCAGYFKGNTLDFDSNGLYNPNRKESDKNKLNFFKAHLANYDGKNGAECAARLALRIADIYQTPYSFEKDFELAKQYAEKSKQIKADLKDDPNTISGIASTANESLENTQFWKAQDDSWKAELQSMKQRALSSSSAGGGRRANVDPAKEAAALRAFEIIHPQIERMAEQIIRSASKVQSAGVLSNFYTGTRQNITNLQRSMTNIYYKFMEEHGDNLPTSLLNHLKSDVGKSVGIRNSYVNGQITSTYDDCSELWSGYDYDC